MVGDDIQSLLRITPRAFSLGMNLVNINIINIEEHGAELEIRNLWDFADSHNVGVFEGTAGRFVDNIDVRIRRHSLCDIDVRFTWDVRSKS